MPDGVYRLLLFIVADVPISAVGLRYGAKRALLAALIAALCAALGGLAMFHWAASDPAGSRAAILALPGITPALFDSASADWRAHGFLAMTMGAFEGVPYKIYAHAAGVRGPAPPGPWARCAAQVRRAGGVPGCGPRVPGVMRPPRVG